MRQSGKVSQNGQFLCCPCSECVGPVVASHADPPAKAGQTASSLRSVHATSLWRPLLQHPTPEASPFAKIEAIALVYFPQFNARLAALNLEATKYRVWMIEAGRLQLDGIVFIFEGNCRVRAYADVSEIFAPTVMPTPFIKCLLEKRE